MTSAYFTIGHSNRSLEAFTGLLREANVTMVVDVRKIPRSRANPQFNSDALSQSLPPCGIAYRMIPQLGGLRSAPANKHSPNDWWENKSFRNYADYALTHDFRAGLAELKSLGESQVPAIMCAEAVWWRCHRRIIADYLMSDGETVLHIMGPGNIVQGTMTPAAEPTSAGITYPSPEDDCFPNGDEPIGT